jgi:hypothetical protein
MSPVSQGRSFTRDIRRASLFRSHSSEQNQSYSVDVSSPARRGSSDKIVAEKPVSRNGPEPIQEQSSQEGSVLSGLTKRVSVRKRLSMLKLGGKKPSVGKESTGMGSLDEE